MKIKERTPLEPGFKVGRLTVIERTKDYHYTDDKWPPRAAYKCICDCGNTVDVLRMALSSGQTKSCGCLQKEAFLKVITKHGGCGTKEYMCWKNMQRRCYNKKVADYKYYGGRGIIVEWENFEDFLKDMGEQPAGMSIDRIDCNKNYCKENCKWSNMSEQCINRRIKESNTSGRTGVSYHIGKCKWEVMLCANGEHIYGGSFEDFEDAVKARESLEEKYHGKVRSEAYETREEDKVHHESN